MLSLTYFTYVFLENIKKIFLNLVITLKNYLDGLLFLLIENSFILLPE